ncbi:integrase core domain-containing protein [Amycolatopsis sp. FDAARGOS 1241]|uniref:Mu transposase domain-containing protein n=1 Tax=Amycolatopsis sp. FDAARGOS 1241 TaxID=2778070 RepID=UPI001EF334B2|nr:integrase core domain-containing protein [Amycolatopsis sp. FDAARGOS 1241]
MNAFRGTLGIKVIQCRPGDPEAKGLVERVNGYLETSFLPGRAFASPADFNTQLTDWLQLANQRRHRRLGCRPVDRWAADRTAMIELPPVAPVTGWRSTIRLPRDHYLRLDSNDYSVHPSVVGRLVHLAADLDEVVVTCEDVEVARHARRWADHQSITDPVHAAAAAQLRQARRLVAVPKVDTSVEHRALTDYDRLFGLESSEEGIA